MSISTTLLKLNVPLISEIMFPSSFLPDSYLNYAYGRKPLDKLQQECPSNVKNKVQSNQCVLYWQGIADEITRRCDMMSLSSIKVSAQRLCFISFECSMHNKGEIQSSSLIHCKKPI